MAVSGKQRPLHEIDQVRADVVQPFALLDRVEKPRRPDVRRARHHFHQVVHALHVDAGIRFGALDDLAKHLRVVDERALQHRGDLEALGHDVVGDHAFAIGLGEHGVELRQVGRGQDPRFVGEHVQAGAHRPRDAIDLRPVASGEDHGVARPLAQHPLEEVGAGVELHLPRGRLLGPLVVGGDAFQVLVEIPALRRIDVHARGHARIHLLLNQGGMKMAGVERHQADVGHAPFLLA